MSDLGAVENFFTSKYVGRKLSCTFMIYGGGADTSVPYETLVEWKTLQQNEQKFSCHVFPDAPHLFIRSTNWSKKIMDDVVAIVHSLGGK